MLRTLKRIIILCCVAVILAIVGVFMYVDHVARVAIEVASTYALGVDTTVGSVDIGILAGTSTIQNLNIDNPPEFETAHLMTIETSSMAVNYSDLPKNVVRIPRLDITGVDMNLEKKSGTTNVSVIIENLKRFESDEPATETDEAGTRFIIDEIVITKIMIHTEILPFGGEVSRIEIPIDEIRLTNVGSDSEKGVLLSELSSVLFKAILAAIVHNGINLPADLLTDLSNGLTSLIPLDDIGIGLQSNVGEALQGLGQGLEDLGKGIGEGLSNLLGGEKKDDQ